MMKPLDPRKYSSVREQQLLDEIKAIEDAAKQEVEEQEEQEASEREDKTLNQEEATYKKRYGDLRRHQQNMENELKGEINKLKTQLEAASRKEVEMPSTEEEFAEWTKRYPDLYRMFRTAIIKETKDELDTKFTKVEERFQELSRKEKEQQKRYAYSKLLEAHPDFEKIKPELQEWLETQPAFIADALVKNEIDYAAAIRAVDLFKVDRDKNSPEKKKQKERDAATSIRPGESSAPSTSASHIKYKESDVANNDWRWYEKHKDEIEKAMREDPAAFYDLSGGAR